MRKSRSFRSLIVLILLFPLVSFAGSYHHPAPDADGNYTYKDGHKECPYGHQIKKKTDYNDLYYKDLTQDLSDDEQQVIQA